MPLLSLVSLAACALLGSSPTDTASPKSTASGSRLTVELQAIDTTDPTHVDPNASCTTRDASYTYDYTNCCPPGWDFLGLTVSGNGVVCLSE